MDQQVAQTLWLPPGMCVLNPLPTMQLHPTAMPRSVSQIVKHPIVTVPAHNLVPNTHLLQQPHVLSSAQNIIHIPVESLVVPSAADHQSLEIPPSVFEIPSGFEIQSGFEIPLQHPTFQAAHTITSQTVTTNLFSDTISQRTEINGVSKVLKKRRISPSAKRRSRLRLIAFLEQKRKQQDQLNYAAKDKKEILSCGTENTQPDAT